MPRSLYCIFEFHNLYPTLVKSLNILYHVLVKNVKKCICLIVAIKVKENILNYL